MTASLVERFGLMTIIVLGEVVIGVARARVLDDGGDEESGQVVGVRHVLAALGRRPHVPA